MKNLIIKIFFITGFVVLVLSIESTALTAEAEGYPISVKFPGVEETTFTGPANYIVALYRFGLIAVGLTAMAMIVFGAIQRIASAGNPSKIQDANDRITSAIWGMVLLLGAYLILYTINPRLVSLRNPTAGVLDPSEIKSPILTLEIKIENATKLAELGDATAKKDLGRYLVEDLKNKNPQQFGESDEEYNNRLRKLLVETREWRTVGTSFSAYEFIPAPVPSDIARPTESAPYGYEIFYDSGTWRTKMDEQGRQWTWDPESKTWK